MEWRSTRTMHGVIHLSSGGTVRFKLLSARTYGSEIHDHALAVAQASLGNGRNEKGKLQVRLLEDSAPIVEIDRHEA